MWISEVKNLMLFPKIWICVGILYFLCLKVEGQCTKPELNEHAGYENIAGQSSFPENFTVRLSCHPGYEPAGGPRTVKCQSGQWIPNPQTFTCRKKSCGNPGDVRNGQYNISEGVEFGAIITTICNVGYYLLGGGQRICLADGTWSGRESVCEVVKCGPPNIIDNGQLESPKEEEYQYGQVVTYKCDQGFTLLGQNQAYCSQNGSWSGGPRCKLINCPRPDIPNAERVEGKSEPYGYRDTLVYKCNKGFTMEGESRIVCEENGWSPAVPQCRATPTSTTPRATQKETTTPKVFTSSPDKITPRTSAKATYSTEGGKNGAPLVHSSLWMVLATVIALAAQNGLFTMSIWDASCL